MFVVGFLVLVTLFLITGLAHARQLKIGRGLLFDWPSLHQFREVSIQTIGACALSAALYTSPSSCFGAVGEGDLPSGAMAFSKLLKYQSEWTKLANSVQERGAVMDEKEVLGLKFFLKQLSNEYYDMELLSTGIVDKAKASEALEIAKGFRKNIRACDDAASAGNIGLITEKYPSTSQQLKTFLELLQDVPDEL